MATRNLARSAVEGGRKRGLEHYDTRAERRIVKVLLHAIRDVEDAIEAPAWPERWTGWDDGFTDKLEPTKRFLQSRAGRPWADVYSELCRRYDRRTFRGYHLLRHIDGHMVNIMIGAAYQSRNGGYPFWANYRPEWGPDGPWVDARGILRYHERISWKTAYRRKANGK